MAVKLSKGQGVNLKKEDPNLRRVLIGLGWDPVEQEKPAIEENTSSGIVGRMKAFFGIAPKQSFDFQVRPKPNFDIDSSIIVIDKDNCHKTTVYYGKLEYHEGAIKHYGDNLTGEGEEGADDEQIEIKLDEIPNKIQRLSIIINIYQAYGRKQTFSQVRNCYVHVTNMDSGKELLRYDIDGNFKGMTGIFVADLERSGGNDWHFKALGEGVKVKDIDEMVAMKCER